MDLKIGIYSPYLDTLGGGERYMLTIAEVLAKENQVDFLLGTHLYSQDLEEIIKKVNLLHGIDLSKVNFIKAPIGKGSSFLKRLFFLKKYDLLFYLTDGSIFYSTAKKNILHFQVPLKNNGNTPWEKYKLSSWKKVIYNSYFTKRIVEKTWPIRGTVVYPPVDVSKIKPLNKKKYILSVGRFFGFSKPKKHEEMIKSFIFLYQTGKIPDWSLHLAGAASDGDQKYLNRLEKLAKGTPVFFHPNVSFGDLVKLYGTSSIYWHAAGFYETDPAKMEHFGITVVEAMAGGSVPVVIGKGGLVETVKDEVSGLLWDSLDELKEDTLALIENQSKLKKLSKKAVGASKKFSKENFTKKIKELVYV